MGNQPSLSVGGDGGGGGVSSTSRQVRGFMRTTGLLGLSKAELDERCKPSGLYPQSQWEDKAIRKLIADGKLAARLRGTENRSSPTDRECPICFLQYREINVTKCCSANICTECYLQVRPQKAKSPSCPFCNHSKVTVSVAQTMNAEAMLAREETEQRVIEAKIRERAEAMSDSSSDAGGRGAGTPVNSESGFGSSLEQHERIASLRARSSSVSDHDNYESIPEDVLRSSFAVTPEERRMLEDEMRAQHSHPLSLRLEAEAEERRLRNEQEFLRNNPHQYIDSRGRSRRSRHHHDQQPRRNWNQIVEAFERGGHGEVNSLDDLVVLEAAMILSMEEESRRRGSNSGAASNASGDSSENFDANRHANEGFPLVRSILSGRQSSARSGGVGASALDGGDQNDQIQSLAHSLYSRRRGRNSLLRGAYGDNNDVADSISALNSSLDTAGLLMRGISEDDQLAMAIAASLQDQQQQQAQQQQQPGDDDDATENDDNNNNDDGEEQMDGSNAGSGAHEEEHGNAGSGGQADADGTGATVDNEASADTVAVAAGDNPINRTGGLPNTTTVDSLDAESSS